MLKAISLLFLGFQMSLYIGKLSPRTRKDELEHIFWRLDVVRYSRKMDMVLLFINLNTSHKLQLEPLWICELEHISSTSTGTIMDLLTSIAFLLRSFTWSITLPRRAVLSICTNRKSFTNFNLLFFCIVWLCSTNLFISYYYWTMVKSNIIFNKNCLNWKWV